MSVELGPGNLPDLIAGLGMLTIAGLVLWLAPTNRVHRAFALLQAVLAASSLTYVFQVGYRASDPVLSLVWEIVDGVNRDQGAGSP